MLSPLHSNTSFDEESFFEESFRDSQYKDIGPMKQNVGQDFGIENITDSKSSLFDFLFSGKKEIKKLCGLFGTVNKTFQRNPTITKDDLKKTFQHYYGVNLEDNGTGNGLFNLVERIRKANIDTEMLNIKRDIKRLGVNYYIDNNTRHERKLLEDEDYEQYGEPIGELFKMLIKNIEDKDTFNFEGSWKLLKRTAKISGDADVKNEDVFGILFVYDKNEASVQGRGIVFHIYRNTFTNFGEKVKMKKVQSYFMVQNNILTIYKKGLQPQIVDAIQNLTGIKLDSINEKANLPNNSSNVNMDAVKAKLKMLQERRGPDSDDELSIIGEDGEYYANEESAGPKLQKFAPYPPPYPLTVETDNSKFEKYEKMLKMGTQKGAVRQKMRTEKISEEEIDKYLGPEEKIDKNFEPQRVESKKKRDNRRATESVNTGNKGNIAEELEKFGFKSGLKPVQVDENRKKVNKEPSTAMKDELLAAAAAREAEAREAEAREAEAREAEAKEASPITVATTLSDDGAEQQRYDREANSEIPAVTISDEELNRLNSEMKYFNFRRSLDKKTILLEKLKEPKKPGDPLNNSNLVGEQGKRFLNNIDTSGYLQPPNVTATSYGGRKTRRRSSNKRRKSKKVGGKKTKPKGKTKGKKIPFKKLLKKTRAKKH